MNYGARFLLSLLIEFPVWSAMGDMCSFAYNPTLTVYGITDYCRRVTIVTNNQNDLFH